MPYTPTSDNAAFPFSPGAQGVATENELYSVYQRPIAERIALMARHMSYVGFASFLKGMGFSDGSDTPTVGHYELPWQEDEIHVGTITTASTGAGTAVTFSVHADNMYDTGITSGGSARQASYALAGDIFELYDRTQVRVMSKDVTVNPHRLTVKPLDSAVDLVTALIAAESYGITHNLFAEASGLPASRSPRIMTYNNTFGLIKHACDISGHELTNAVYHETIVGDASSARQSIIVTMKHEDIIRYERSKSNLLLFGQQATGLNELVTETSMDTPINSTEGFVQFGLTSGLQDTYTVGSYALTDFDVIADHLYDERAITSSNLVTLDGPTITTETENMLNTFFVNDLSPFINNLIDGYTETFKGLHQTLDTADATAGFGYSVVKKNGLLFHMKRLSEFNDIKVVGNTNYAYRNYRMVAPMGLTNDIRTSKSRPMCGYEYKALNNYSREDVMGNIVGAGVGGDNSPFGPAVNPTDTYKRFQISHLAGHWATGNAIVMQIPA